MTQVRVAASTLPRDEDDPAPEGQEPALHFAGGLPGFPDAHHFAIARLSPDYGPFCRMYSLDIPGLEFIVVPPGAIFSDYVVDVDSGDVERLSLTLQNVVVLVIVTVGAPDAIPTVNLLGPVIINRDSRQAMQVVQHKSKYKVAVPVTGSSALS